MLIDIKATTRFFLIRKHMKPATHPRITYTGIILSVVINVIGLLVLLETGHAGTIFAGFAFSFVVWIDIIVDRGRRLPSFLPEEGYIPLGTVPDENHKEDRF
jgi:hypothetical protein